MNIIELAKEAGFPSLTEYGEECLERFAALVRAEERKRTVEILMELHRKANGQHNYYHYAANEVQGFNVSAEREWVDLTDEELAESLGWKLGDPMYMTVVGLGQEAIAAFKEKNK